MIKIAGFQKNSFIDYPGKIAAVIYLGGCNMRCFYCHNNPILCPTSNQLEFTPILDELREQTGFLDAVVITGGEPTLHPHLTQIIAQIKALGFLIKLDTNGTNPQLLRDLTENGHVDYVAMDIKAPLDRYNEICGITNTESIKQSIDFLIGQTRIPYMFRTTLVPQLQEPDILAIANLIKGATTYQIQQFIPNEFSNSHRTIQLPHPPSEIQRLAKLVEPFVSQVLIRGLS